jgi:hypothetical protein
LKEIDNIVKGSYKVTEKENMLSELKEKIDNEFKNAREEIHKGYRYCPQCGEWYKEKAFDNYSKTERRNICTFRDPCEFGEDKYEDKDCVVDYSECPMGHIEEIRCTPHY